MECEYCQTTQNKVYELDSKKLCYLCYCIRKFTKQDIYNYVICYSELNQIDIIKQTWNLYNKNGTIPLPTEIDPSVQLVKINIYVFLLTQNFGKYKIFFTNKLDDVVNTEIENIFKVKSKKCNFVEYYKLPIYQNINFKNQKNMINYTKNEYNKLFLEYENKLISL